MNSDFSWSDTIFPHFAQNKPPIPVRNIQMTVQHFRFPRYLQRIVLDRKSHIFNMNFYGAREFSDTMLLHLFLIKSKSQIRNVVRSRGLFRERRHFDWLKMKLQKWFFWLFHLTNPVDLSITSTFSGINYIQGQCSFLVVRSNDSKIKLRFDFFRVQNTSHEISQYQRWANSGLAQTKKFWSGKNPDQNENLVWIDENEIEWSSDIFQSIAIQF